MKNGEQPAFPQTPVGVTSDYPISGGLTKREYFAVMAMQALIPKDGWYKQIIMDDSKSSYQLAQASIKMADELIEQLEF